MVGFYNWAYFSRATFHKTTNHWLFQLKMKYDWMESQMWYRSISVKMRPNIDCVAWMGKETIICHWSHWLALVLWMKEKESKSAISAVFPLLWAWSALAAQTDKHFRRNKPYCFHVTYVINWLLLPLTQIIAGVYNAKKIDTIWQSILYNRHGDRKSRNVTKVEKQREM